MQANRAGSAYYLSAVRPCKECLQAFPRQAVPSLLPKEKIHHAAEREDRSCRIDGTAWIQESFWSCSRDIRPIRNGKRHFGQNISDKLTKVSFLICNFVDEDTGGCRSPYHSQSKAVPAAGDCSMEDIAMRRKPKMHNEQEFDIDNIYQEDDRQLEVREPYSFDGIVRQF